MAVWLDERIGLFWPPTASLIEANAMVLLKNRIDHGPGRFDRVFAGEERAVAGHGIAEEALVRGFFSRLFFDHVKLFLVAHELLAGGLHTRGQRYGGTWRDPEAQIIARASRRGGVGE